MARRIRMVRRKTPGKSEPEKKPNLAKPRIEVEAKLRERIKVAEEIVNSDIQYREDLEKFQSRFTKWDKYNIDYLQRCFDTDLIAEEYQRVSNWGSMFMNPTFGQLVSGFKSGVQNKITALESILERLELFPEMFDVDNISGIQPTFQKQSNSEVFIVHGHDEAAKNSVARFVEKIGLKPIILHEKPNQGKTIIEKFESHASTVGYAIVLLTPDDIGTSKETPNDVKARARQNVVLELGYFTGLLGRDRVCVLYKEGVEIPSDYMGILYTKFDSAEGWHLKLAAEMKGAGLEVDLNKALE